MIYLRKICSVVLALIMTTVMPILPATAEFSTELVSNGGFETLSADKTAAEEWAGFRTWTNGSVLSLVNGADEPENVHSGNYAVKYDTKAGDNPYLSQVISDIQPEHKYRVSFWYKGEVTGKGVSVKFEQSGNGQYSEYYTSPFADSSSAWKYVEHEFYMNENTTVIKMMPRTYSEGTVIYIDDLSLMLIDTPKRFQTEFDGVFYYPEHGEATVTAEMHSYYSDEGCTADIKVTAENGEQVYTESVAFVNRRIEHKIDIRSFGKKTEYTIKVTFRDASGNVLESAEQSIYIFDRPTAISEDGVYMIDGESFEPVFMYHIGREDYEKAREGGINVVQWNPLPHLNDYDYLIEELNYMHSIGMMAAVVCYWNMYPAGHERNAENVKKLVAHIKDHPAVFSYMVMDEPFSHFSNAAEYLLEAYKIIRMIDDKHPIYLCEDLSTRYLLSLSYVDTLGIDPYPSREGDFSKYVGDKVTEAVNASNGIKPVFATLQAFSWYGITPTPEMLRTQQYQALMAGAQGIGYYTWDTDNPELDADLHEGRYWNTVVSFSKLDKPILYAYYCRGEMNTINTYRGDDLWYDVFTDGITCYAAVQLRSTTEKTVNVSLKNAEGAAIPENYTMSVVNGGDMADVTRNADSFTANIDGYGAVLYKFTPPAGEIHIVNGEREEIADAGDITGNVTAFAGGLEDGDRLYVALYKEINGTQVLEYVAVGSAKEGMASCSVDNLTDSGYSLKAFVWTENMGIKYIKTID